MYIGANRERGGQNFGLLCRTNFTVDTMLWYLKQSNNLTCNNAMTTVWLFLSCDIGVLVKLYYWFMYQFWGSYVLISDKIYFSFLIKN